MDSVFSRIVNIVLQVTDLLDETEFVIVPFVNPDGYSVRIQNKTSNREVIMIISLFPQFTWTGDRLWRKNRQPGNPCAGVDLNRNYPDHWAEVTAAK